MIPISNILIPTDFSEPAEAAWQYAQTLAKEFGSRLHVLHIVLEPYVYPWGTEISALPLTDFLTQSEQAARDRLAHMVPAAGPLSGQVTVSTAIGTPVEQILEYISTKGID